MSDFRAGTGEVQNEPQYLDPDKQVELADVCRASLHPATAEDMLFSSRDGTFFRMDHKLHYKTHLNKFKRIEKNPPQNTSNLNPATYKRAVQHDQVVFISRM